jgi:hypothetical protein
MRYILLAAALLMQQGTPTQPPTSAEVILNVLAKQPDYKPCSAKRWPHWAGLFCCGRGGKREGMLY